MPWEIIKRYKTIKCKDINRCINRP